MFSSKLKYRWPAIANLSQMPSLEQSNISEQFATMFNTFAHSSFGNMLPLGPGTENLTCKTPSLYNADFFLLLSNPRSNWISFPVRVTLNVPSQVANSGGVTSIICL